MERTLYEGDLIFVSKLAYGPRVPGSIFEIPWFNTIARSFISKAPKDFNYKPHGRFSGCSKINRGDIAVFHDPSKPGGLVIKRCVGIPGDSIKKKNDVYSINANQFFNGSYSRKHYYFEKDKVLKIKAIFDSLDLVLKFKKTDDFNVYATQLTSSEFEKIDNQCLLWRPKHLVSKDTMFVLKKDHFFMLGDNTSNSIDSRIWGPVDKHLIIGKAEVVIFSKARNRFSWKRIIHSLK